VAANRFNISGRGSHEPLVPNTSDANRAKNRRVEIFVAEQQAGTGPAPAPAGYAPGRYPPPPPPQRDDHLLTLWHVNENEKSPNFGSGIFGGQ
jgi:hypothetical protein